MHPEELAVIIFDNGEVNPNAIQSCGNVVTHSFVFPFFLAFHRYNSNCLWIDSALIVF